MNKEMIFIGMILLSSLVISQESHFISGFDEKLGLKYSINEVTDSKAFLGVFQSSGSVYWNILLVQRNTSKNGKYDLLIHAGTVKKFYNSKKIDFVIDREKYSYDLVLDGENGLAFASIRDQDLAHLLVKISKANRVFIVVDGEVSQSLTVEQKQEALKFSELWRKV